MNQPGYFFYDKTKYNTEAAQIAREYKERIKRIRGVDGRAIHSTADPAHTHRYGELDVLSAVKAVRDAFGSSQRLGHIQLFCGTANSALYPTLRPFKFN